MKAHHPYVLALACGACLGADAFGQLTKIPPKLLAAKAEYTAQAEKARSAHIDAIKQNVEDYKKALAAILDEETKAGRVDEAILVKNELRLAQEWVLATLTPADKPGLQKALAGTKWHWGDGDLTLLPGGDVSHPVWIASKLVTRWKVVDRRTVILTIEKGRDSDRIAVLTFNEPLDEFTGIGFEKGQPLGRKKRVADK